MKNIPHITNNIIPLFNILKLYAQDAYKTIVTTLENLAADNASDSARKRTLLTQIVLLRETFVKVYTLTKWAANSQDVSKCIDLLSWLRQQEFQFDQLGFQLHSLNGFTGAKLPDPDLQTALEVLLKGRPQLPSYGYVKAPPISARKTLEVLQDLNLVLTARMALAEDVPVRFQDYSVRDGRVVLRAEHEFEVHVTVASGEIEQSSPYYFVDFHLLFGMDPESALVVDMTTRLPPQSHANLEKAANSALAKDGLGGLYTLLHKFAVMFKLYLLARQLKGMVSFAKWRNSLQYNYNTGSSLIVVNYWSAQGLSRGWRSFVEVGIDSDSRLHVRWFKNGRYQKEDGGPREQRELSMESIVSVVVTKHSEMLIHKIRRALEERGATVSVSDLQLVLQLTPGTRVVFSINTATGSFYFHEPTPLHAQVARKINKLVVDSERELVAYIADQLSEMQLESFAREVRRKLMASGWINSEVVRLGKKDQEMLMRERSERSVRSEEASEEVEAEKENSMEKAVEKETSMEKVVEKAAEKNDMDTSTLPPSIRFFRRKSWLPSWFLICLISPFRTSTSWWVSRIKSVSGEWQIQWMNALPSPYARLDYAYFSSLASMCSNMIIDHMVLEELTSRGVRWLKADISRLWAEMKMPPRPVDTGAYSSTLVLHNDSLLPVESSASVLFLTIDVGKSGLASKVAHGVLRMSGKLRNIPVAQRAPLARLLRFDPEHEAFEISDTMDLAMDEAPGPVLGRIFDAVNRLSALVTLLGDLGRSGFEVVGNSASSVVVRIDDSLEPVSIDLPDRQGDPVQLSVKGSLMHLIAYYINAGLREREDSHSLIAIVRFLKELAPIVKSAATIAQKVAAEPMRLPNGLRRLAFDTKVVSLGVFQYVYHISYTSPSAPKKTLKDKVLVTLTLGANRFAKKNANLVKVSFRDNFNKKNLKYKSLFEMIFKEISDLEQKTKKVIKLNYDFLLEGGMVEEVMVRVSNCFCEYLQAQK